MSGSDLTEALAKFTISRSPSQNNSETMATEVVSLAEFNKLKIQMKVLTKRLPEEVERNNRKTAGSVERARIDKDPPPENASGLKPTPLPDFDGTRNNYAAWCMAVLDTFRMDWSLFGYDDSRAFLMIHRAMKESALAKVGPFYERGGVQGTRKPEDFIEFLDRLNLDPMRVARANDELHNLRIGERQKWPDFYATWSNKLTVARGDVWDDSNKISMLRNSLNDRLIAILAGNHPLPEDDFDERVKIVGRVAQQLEVVDGRSRRSKQTAISEFSRTLQKERCEKKDVKIQSPQDNYSTIK